MIDRIDDEPVQFYFRHRAQIEEWAGLAKAAQATTRAILDTLSMRLQERHPANASVLTGVDGPYQRVAFYREEWRNSELGDLPLIGLGMGWNPATVTLPFLETCGHGSAYGEDRVRRERRRSH